MLKNYLTVEQMADIEALKNSKVSSGVKEILTKELIILFLKEKIDQLGETK